MFKTGQFHLVVQESDTAAHLRLTGEFDLAAVAPVENALDRVFRTQRTRRVVFDLRRLTFLDGAGLRAILRANERARSAALELILVRPRGTVNRVFTLTRVSKELAMVDEPELAARARPASADGGELRVDRTHLIGPVAHREREQP